MIRRRAAAAGIAEAIGCHTFRATGITAYLANGGALELVDVSDIVETQREEYTETALLTVRCYNNVEKKCSYYGVPYPVGASMNHIWRPLVEKAGYQMSDIPKTWDAYYDFFKDVQKKLGAQGMRASYRAPPLCVNGLNRSPGRERVGPLAEREP